MRRVRESGFVAALPFAILCAIVACSGQAELPVDPDGMSGTDASGAVGGTAGGGMGGLSGSGGAAGTANRAGTSGKGGSINVDAGGPEECPPLTCGELNYACGYIRDECGKIINCADEGLTCGPLEACMGGVDGPTECKTSLGEDCTACESVPDCSAAAQDTILTGRVITAGRDDANAANQVGVPNAFVYILRTNDPADLPDISSGIPAGGTSCDRCEDQDLGPLMVGALTNAKGEFTLEGNIPVGAEFILVVKAGRFRRAIRYTVPEADACTTKSLGTALPENPTRLPRDMMDGLAVNLPRIAVTTGALDAMECVLEKMGIAHGEFSNPGGDGTAASRVHLYRGGPANGPQGARIDAETPHDATIYGDLARLQSYDIVVSDCEGQAYDAMGSERMNYGDAVREYVNRGGRFFASHLSYTWLYENGDQPYSADDPIATGLNAAATWTTALNQFPLGTGTVSVGRPQASPRIDNFAEWMVNEGVTQQGVNTFDIVDPRSQTTGLGESSEEFAYRSDTTDNDELRVQQFSVNTPYGAPPEAVCGRISHSGFHVSIARGNNMAGAGGGAGMGGGGGAGGTGGTGTGGGFGQGGGFGGPADNQNAQFPQHCTGDLTDQEKVLLYMLFDLNACVGEVPPPPECEPATCDSLGAECGFANDGCGNPLDCGACPVMPPK